jgi:hypothetical protein
MGYLDEGIHSADVEQSIPVARILLIVEKLPDHSEDRIMLPESALRPIIEAEIKEAMLKARARLVARAVHYNVTGWTWDQDDIVYDLTHDKGSVVAKLRLERPL